MNTATTPLPGRRRSIPRALHAVRRLGAAGLTLLGATLLAFVVLAGLPGDPTTALAPPEGSRQATPAEVAALAARHGLDRPFLVRYVDWLGAALRGDLGRSLRSGLPVADEIGARLPATLELNLAALGLALGLGLPLGWLAALRAGTMLDRLLSATLLAAYAVPGFWLALLLQDVIGVRWGLLPVYGRSLPGDDSLDVRLAHLLLPACCLALHQLAFVARIARAAAAEGWTAPHAELARVLGVGGGRRFLDHALRPSFVPLAQLAGLLVPTLLSGSVLIENVFAWPGLGTLLVEAVRGRDLPLVLGLTVLAAAATIAGSLLADALARAADPRLRDAPRTPTGARAGEAP